MPNRRFALALLVLIPLPAPPLAAATPDAIVAEYERSMAWRYATTPIQVPAGGLSWTIDTATWTLSSGRIWLAEPTADGVVTGLVFEGEGRFTMGVPDRIELRQLRRFAADPELERIDQRFASLVLRGAHAPPLDRLELPAGAAFEKHELAAERQQQWLKLFWVDADALVVAALAGPGRPYLRVEMDTADHGWMTYTYDDLRREEIELEVWQKRHSFLESWLSLDRPADRLSSGRPGPARVASIVPTHFDVTADLTKTGLEQVGFSDQPQIVGRFTVEMSYRAPVPSGQALRLSLHPRAEVRSIVDGDGRRIPFLRDHLGARTTSLEKDVYDLSLVAILPAPLAAGDTGTLAFEYQLELSSYGPGRLWYPTPQGLIDDFEHGHTGRLTLTIPDDREVRAVGELVEERDEGKEKTAVWRVERPTKMLTFVVNRKPFEETLAFEGLPDVVAFASLGGRMTERRVSHVSADTVNSLNYFKQRLGLEVDTDRLFVSFIPAAHGQSFRGFLHIGDFTTSVESVGAKEMFHAHEVAHQWWGHSVGWDGYRHQWLSEGLAEYAAMMFMEETVDNGDKLMQQALAAYNNEITGSIQSAFSPFSRPGVALMNMSAVDRLGPIGHGYRCATGDAPAGYQSQVYVKGALVFHMLRTLLRRMTGSDDAFRAVLADFEATHRGGIASTEDFQAVLTEHVPAEWGWFFDQWVYGSEVPTYRWDYDVVRGTDGGWVVELEVEQSDVSAGFRMPVLVRFELAGGRVGDVLAMVDAPTKSFSFPVPAKPKKVIFNPDVAVIGRVKKK